MLHSIPSFRRLLALTLLLASPLVSALGVNSCSGTNACTGVDTTLIGDNACNGDNACQNLKPQNLVQNACNGFFACWDAGTGSGLTMTIGPGSCNGPTACQTQNNPHPETTIGANSCVGQSACAGWTGFFRAADNACQGALACLANSGVVGNDACNGVSACRQRSAGFSVDNRSCNGDDACVGSLANIGIDSCSGAGACRTHGGRVGSRSCNGAATCANSFEEVPDCARNRVRPATCVNPDLRITLSDGATRTRQGDPVSYTIVASNDAGTNTELSATIAATFPAGLVGCGVTSVATGGASGNDPGPTAGLDDGGVLLPPASAVTYTAVCTIAGSARGALTLAATVTSSTLDPAPFDNSAEDVDTLAVSARGFGTVADSGDGVLAADEAIEVGATQVLVDFDGAMSDPPGNSTSGDVTDPANYLLLSAGANGVFDTAPCATPFGDDAEALLAGVRYDAATPRATLLPTGALALAAGTYRIDVCSTLRDSGDYPILAASRAFVVHGSNRLVQPNFDADLTGWSGTGARQWSSADAGAAASSGSAGIVTDSGVDATFDLGQCVAVADRYFTARARLRIATATPGAPNASVIAEHFASGDCTGAVLASSASPAVVGDTALVWRPAAVEGRVPAAAHSTRFRVHVLGDTAAAFAIDVDDTYYGDPGRVFDDGLE